MTEPSMCGGDAPLCQITLTNCFDLSWDVIVPCGVLVLCRRRQSSSAVWLVVSRCDAGSCGSPAVIQCCSGWFSSSQSSPVTVPRDIACAPASCTSQPFNGRQCLCQCARYAGYFFLFSARILPFPRFPGGPGYIFSSVFLLHFTVWRRCYGAEMAQITVLRTFNVVFVIQIHMLIAISKGMRAVKLRSRRILQFLTGSAG